MRAGSDSVKTTHRNTTVTGPNCRFLALYSYPYLLVRDLKFDFLRFVR